MICSPLFDCGSTTALLYRIADFSRSLFTPTITFNYTLPVEHLWQWLREDLTYHTCYDSQQDLIDAVADFQHQINTDPLSISDRLWVKKHLESEEEKLRFSK